jgi:hypothetical protein
MTRFLTISAATLITAMALPIAATPGHSPITAEQVAAAISGTGMSVSPEQVTLLSNVVAKSGTPRLDVESIEPWGNHRMKVRLDCANHDQCLPFYVSVQLDAVRLNQNASDPSAAALSNQQSSTDAGQNHDPKAFLVRAGSRATLLIDTGHVHIRLSVVCLENGAAGQKIRVECKDPRQTYVARVVDGGVLRGNL